MRQIIARGTSSSSPSTIVVHSSGNSSIVSRFALIAVPGVGVYAYIKYKGYSIADIQWVSASRFAEAVNVIGKAQEVLDTKLVSFRASAEHALTGYTRTTHTQARSRVDLFSSHSLAFFSLTFSYTHTLNPNIFWPIVQACPVSLLLYLSLSLSCAHGLFYALSLILSFCLPLSQSLTQSLTHDLLRRAFSLSVCVCLILSLSLALTLALVRACDVSLHTGFRSIVERKFSEQQQQIEDSVGTSMFATNVACRTVRMNHVTHVE